LAIHNIFIPETDNVVNRRAGDGYENVSEYIKIGQPNIGTLAKLDALEPTETFGDREPFTHYSRYREVLY
jgi:hypothetical protein